MSDNTNLPVVIYDPESRIRNPLQLLKGMVSDLFRSNNLAWRLFVRDISAQYRQSVLGIFWTIFPPIVTSLIFIILQSRRIISFEETTLSYPVYVLVGTLLWQIFAESLSSPIKTVNLSRPILVKINIPYEALILSSIYNMLFSLMVKLIVLAGVLIIFKVELTLGILLTPFAFIALIFLGLTIGLFLTPIGMLYTDISSSLPVVTQLWFFITPVIYPPPTTSPLNLLTVINPVSPLLIGARDLIATGSLTNPVPFITVILLIPIFFILAWLIFKLSIPIIIERISA